MPPALIVGDDPVTGLGVARNLGRVGVAVHRLGAVREPRLCSRYIRTQSVVPGLDEAGDDGYLRALETVSMRIGSPAVLLPITDLHVLRLSRLEETLTGRFRMTTPSFASAETLVNKRHFYEAAAALGVRHPATRFPETLDDFERAAEMIGYPVYLKPEISPLFHRAFHKKGFVARDREELRAHAAMVVASGLRVMLQEIIPGDATQMHGCAGYRRGSETVWICYRRAREYPAGFGCGSMLESCESFVHQTRLLELLASLGYRGLFDAEFKLDPRSGEYCLIEINARSWWQNLLPTRSGINLIDVAYREAAGSAAPMPAQRYEVGVKWIHGYNDFHAAREEGLGLVRWLRSISGRGDFAFFAPDDPMPAAVQISGLAWGRLRSLAGFRPAHASAASTASPPAPAQHPAQQTRS
ncbi:MAG: hypothetical protein ACM3PF_06395 [Bacteroidota bacterium]